MIFRDFAFSMAWVLRFTSSFENRLETCVFIVLSETNNLSAISLLDNPSEISRRISYSRLLIPRSAIFWLSICFSSEWSSALPEDFRLSSIPMTRNNNAIPATTNSISRLPLVTEYLLNWKSVRSTITSSVKIIMVFFTLKCRKFRAYFFMILPSKTFIPVLFIT